MDIRIDEAFLVKLLHMIEVYNNTLSPTVAPPVQRQGCGAVMTPSWGLR